MHTLKKLNHEKLEVYQVSIQFLLLATKFSRKIPRGNGEIKDQLRRSSISIVLNISEGYGKSQPKDRAKFYDIAKGSSHEAAAIFDICNILGIISYEEYSQGKNLLFRIVCMLVKLCQFEKSSPAATPTPMTNVEKSKV